MKVSEFNEKVKNKYLKMENIRIAFNSIFSQNGMICEHLFKDSIRLSPEGVGVLAGNLKRGLLIRVNGSDSYSRPPYQRTPNTRSNNLYRIKTCKTTDKIGIHTGICHHKMFVTTIMDITLKVKTN